MGTQDPAADLLPGARRAAAIADVGGDDFVLIVSDNPRIADALVQALKERPSGPDIPIEVVYLARPLRPITAMGRSLSAAFKQATVVFNVLAAYHDEPELLQDEPVFRKQIITPQNRTQRIFHMPGITEEAFTGEGALGLNDAEFDEMEVLTRELAVALTIARWARVTSARQAETDFTLDLGNVNNVGQLSTGRLQPRSWGNLPSGEAFILPVSARGSVLIDTAVSGLNELTPFKATLIDGQFSLDGDADTPLRSMIASWEEQARQTKGMDPHNVRRICEFGIGTNPRARPPSFIEIEKILGTIHIAIGRNDGFGGPISAPNHSDMVVAAPTVALDGVEIISGGKVHRDLLRAFASSAHDTSAAPEFSDDAIVWRSGGVEVFDDGEFLYRRWTDARNNILEGLVGSHDTARVARGVWHSFVQPRSRWIRWALPKRGGRWVRQVLDDARRGKLDGVRPQDDVSRALRVMRMYGLVSIGRPRRSDEV